jgi:hypothetical protein
MFICILLMSLLILHIFIFFASVIRLQSTFLNGLAFSVSFYIHSQDLNLKIKQVLSLVKEELS